LLADINEWIRNPATNHGWFLISDAEGTVATARHFGSSESASPPELLIRYSFPAVAPTISNARRESTNFVFEVQGSAGWFYSLQIREFIDSGVWTAFTNVPAGAALTPIIITVPAMNSQQYFRAFRY
jgi:hypothetical protein